MGCVPCGKSAPMRVERPQVAQNYVAQKEAAQPKPVSPPQTFDATKNTHPYRINK